MLRFPSSFRLLITCSCMADVTDGDSVFKNDYLKIL